MLNAAELTRRRNRVLGAIDKLTVADALAVMSAAMHELAEKEATDRPVAANDAEPFSVDLILEGEGEARRLKVDRDSEVRDFIHGLRGLLSISQIQIKCQERFGDRAPSSSSLYRYFDSLKYRRGDGGKRDE
ncbi:hypothetical protein [Halomonas sp.]|uniref:hypothetical protein n=1 Tax=Halomonas sp. TaxID=1486246 RepID=UPI00298E5D84|nr:hypothetical protein [Halomonas sp.]MDW7745864.1 hypothetical protein [Halomonas sp.]